MKPFRVSIAGVMGIVVIAAVGLMGLREGTPIWASLTFGLTLLFLLGASLNAALRKPIDRAGWLGFAAMFGWVYLLLNFGPWAKLELPPMPNAWLVDESLARLHPEPEYEPNDTWQTTAMNVTYSVQIQRLRHQLKPGSVEWSGSATHYRQTAKFVQHSASGDRRMIWSRWLARRIAKRDEAATHPESA